jgi:hypothetical protein
MADESGIILGIIFKLIFLGGWIALEAFNFAVEIGDEFLVLPLAEYFEFCFGFEFGL